MICGRRQLPSAPPGSLLSMTVIEMREFLKLRGVKGLSKLTRLQLCELMIKAGHGAKKSKRNLIAYDGVNNCYLDTALFAIFQCSAHWLKHNILKHPRLSDMSRKIRKELIGMYNHLFSKTRSDPINLSKLRRMFQAFDHEYGRNIEAIDWLHTQQEPRDVFQILMRIFDIQPDVCISVNGDMRDMFFTSPNVSSWDLKSKPRVFFDDYFPIYDDPDTGVHTEYESARFICFNVDRNYLDEKVTTIFTFPPKTRVTDGNILYLDSVIVHHGAASGSGHYTCMFKIDSTWFHFDDMETELLQIGSFKEMLKWNSGLVLRNCTCLLFSEKS